MRRIAIINQKGGVGKTTTATNLGAALARAGKRVVVVDMDPQANLSLYLGCEARSGEPTIYGVLVAGLALQDALRPTRTPGLWLIPSHIDLSGAELELAATIGRETVLRDALDTWEQGGAEVPDRSGVSGPIDYLLLDCPPSLGLLSINALASAYEVLISVQTEFFALQGLGKLVEVIQLMQRRLNPRLELTGLLPNLYDNRLRLAREVLGELRRFFPGKVYASSIRSNVKLAESPSHSLTIFEYAPDSNGAKDYSGLAQEVIEQEALLAAPAAAPAAPGTSEELLAAAEALRKVEEAQRAEVQPVPRAEPEPEAQAEAGPEPEPAEEATEPVVTLEPPAPGAASEGQPSALEEPEPDPLPDNSPVSEWSTESGVPEMPASVLGPEPEEPSDEEGPDPLVTLEERPASGEPLPFGVIIPPGPDSRVEFRSASVPTSPSRTATAVLSDEFEEVGALDSLEEEAIEHELDGLSAPAPSPEPAEAEAAPLVEDFAPEEVALEALAPEPQPSPEPPAPVAALPVYGFDRYIGEDRAHPPGRGGPAHSRA